MPAHFPGLPGRKSVNKGFEFTLLRELRLVKLTLITELIHNYSMMLGHSFGYCDDGIGLRASRDRRREAQKGLVVDNWQLHHSLV